MSSNTNESQQGIPKQPQMSQTSSNESSETGQKRSKQLSVFDIVFKKAWNLQFTSSRGMARHMFGGYFLGFALAFGIFLFVICYFFNDYYFPSKRSDGNGNDNINDNNSVITFQTGILPFALYITFSAFCYTLEYTWHAMFHPETLDFDAFILYTHSRAFHIALVAAFIEYFVEYFVFARMKVFGYIHFIGLLILIIGQIFRSMAQFTAGVNFTHLIATEKRETHRLIKHGVYSVSRHPSYFGWFWWSVGTQILLCNPVCVFAYAFASWNFFKERIPFEEAYLIRFFGQEYIEYKEKVPIGIPFLPQH